MECQKVASLKLLIFLASLSDVTVLINIFLEDQLWCVSLQIIGRYQFFLKNTVTDVQENLDYLSNIAHIIICNVYFCLHIGNASNTSLERMCIKTSNWSCQINHYSSCFMQHFQYCIRPANNFQRKRHALKLDWQSSFS